MCENWVMFTSTFTLNFYFLFAIHHNMGFIVLCTCMNAILSFFYKNIRSDSLFNLIFQFFMSRVNSFQTKTTVTIES